MHSSAARRHRAAKKNRKTTDNMPKNNQTPSLKFGAPLSAPEAKQIEGSSNTVPSIPENPIATKSPIINAEAPNAPTQSFLGSSTMLGVGDSEEEIPNMKLDSFSKAFQTTKEVLDIPAEIEPEIQTETLKDQSVKGNKKTVTFQKNIPGGGDYHNPVNVEQAGADVPGGSSEEVTDPSVLAELNSQLNLQSALQAPGYPDPRDVLSDKNQAISFAASRNFERLRLVDSRVIKSSGPIMLNTSTNSIVLSAYEQLQIVIGGLFYSLLPDPGYEPETFESLHAIHIANNNPAVILSEKYGDKCRQAVKQLIELSVDVVLDKIASAIFKKESVHSTHYFNVMDVSECSTVLDELRNNAPQMYALYKMVFQIVHGGQVCVDPIPEILAYDSAMDEYMGIICQGANPIPASCVSIPARNPRLQITSVKIPSAVNIANQKAGSQISQKEPTKFNVSGPKGNMKAKKPAVNPNELIMQGFPGRYQIDRNTTEFRDSVEADSVVDEKLNMIMDSLVLITNTMQTMQETMNAMSERQNKIDQSFAILIAQNNQGDLSARVNMNQALFTAPSSSATTILQAAPPKVIPTGAQVKALLDRLNAISGTNKDQTLRDDLIKLMKSIGDNLGASTVTHAALSLPTARARLIERIKNYKVNMEDVGVMK